jgi:metallopeptidase MepB
MNHTQESARCPPQPPLNFATLADPTSVLQASNKLCENLQQFVDNLVSTVTSANATFDNVVLQLLQHENEMQLTSSPISILSLVAPDTELRNAAGEASDKISHCIMDCKESNMDLFRLIDAVYQRQKDDHTRDAESRKALVEERRSYIRKGLGLLGNPIEEDANGSSKASSSLATFRYNTRRLQTIQSEFLKNLDEKPHHIWLTRAELAGVPEDALSGLDTGTGEFDGKLKLDLNGMPSRWILAVASSPVTRQKIYLESRRIVSQDCLNFFSN